MTKEEKQEADIVKAMREINELSLLLRNSQSREETHSVADKMTEAINKVVKTKSYLED